MLMLFGSLFIGVSMVRCISLTSWNKISHFHFEVRLGVRSLTDASLTICMFFPKMFMRWHWSMLSPHCEQLSMICVLCTHFSFGHDVHPQFKFSLLNILNIESIINSTQTAWNCFTMGPWVIVDLATVRFGYRVLLDLLG